MHTDMCVSKRTFAHRYNTPKLITTWHVLQQLYGKYCRIGFPLKLMFCNPFIINGTESIIWEFLHALYTVSFSPHTKNYYNTFMTLAQFAHAISCECFHIKSRFHHCKCEQHWTNTSSNHNELVMGGNVRSHLVNKRKHYNQIKTPPQFQHVISDYDLGSGEFNS